MAMTSSSQQDAAAELTTLPIRHSDDNDNNNNDNFGTNDDDWQDVSQHDARPLLPKVSFFLGDLRDGLPMVRLFMFFVGHGHSEKRPFYSPALTHTFFQTIKQLNMQAVFLLSSREYTEKQIGVLFLMFGLSQFLCMAPAGYILDYSHHKIRWVQIASILCAALTVLSTLSAQTAGQNLGWMIFLTVLQGACTAVLPPGFNSITMGIVGSRGFTHQVSRNRMMNHIGTALVVAAGSLMAYITYPNMGALFAVSPAAAAGVYYHLHRIVPTHVHRDAARGLILESPTMNEYELADQVAAVKQQAARLLMRQCSGGNNNNNNNSVSRSRRDGSDNHHNNNNSAVNTAMPQKNTTSGYQAPAVVSTTTVRDGSECRVPAVPSSSSREPPKSTTTHIKVSSADTEKDTTGQKSYNSLPSFNFGWKPATSYTTSEPEKRPRTPLAVLLNPTLLIFTAVVFFFHLANSSVLPLVMQSLALQDVQAGILLSGLCILIAQGCMAFFAKLSGDVSPYWGRKKLILVGLVSLTIRCFVLTLLLSAEETIVTERGNHVLKALILSTQFLDSVGAGIVGTLQILVTSDLSGGTGRFSLLLGFTTASMCLGATVSGYLGQALAQDYGYPFAFTALGLVSLIPFLMYVFLMPETLPDYARAQPRQQRLRELLQRWNEQRRRILQKHWRGSSSSSSLLASRQQQQQQQQQHSVELV